MKSKAGRRVLVVVFAVSCTLLCLAAIIGWHVLRDAEFRHDVDSLVSLVSSAESVRFKLCADTVGDYCVISPKQAADAIRKLQLTSALGEYPYVTVSAELIIIEFENGENSGSIHVVGTAEQPEQVDYYPDRNVFEGVQSATLAADATECFRIFRSYVKDGED